jgi:hypothetical protein
VKKIRKVVVIAGEVEGSNKGTDEDQTIDMVHV